MDDRSQIFFNEILKKNPDELNEDEVIFLRSRRSYLKKSQLEEYQDVINKEDKKVQNQTSDKETVKSHASTTK